MNSAVSFSSQCYDWGANLSCFTPSSTPRQGIIGNLPEYLKGVARCVYVIAVATFVAPIGALYHLSQASLKGSQYLLTSDDQKAQDLSSHAWSHLKAFGEDLESYLHASFITVVGLRILNLSGVCLVSAIAVNSLALFVIGGLGTAIGAYAIYKSHIPQAWNSLHDVNLRIQRDFDYIVPDTLLVAFHISLFFIRFE